MPAPNPAPDTDPPEALRVLIERGAGNTPDAIMLRLLWLRQVHPQATVSTEALHIADDRVVMRAAIALTDGAAGSGISAARVGDGDDWADLVERTETIAISRALDTLGYVLRIATGETRSDEPQESASPDREPEVMEAAPEMAGSETQQRSAPAQMAESAPSVVNALRHTHRPAPAEPPASERAPGPTDDDVHLEEYSWNSFWSRARELGLTPDKVTELLGQPAPKMTPREAVSGLIEAGAWPTREDS